MSTTYTAADLKIVANSLKSSVSGQDAAPAAGSFGWQLGAATKAIAGIDVVSTWGDYTGKGVSIGIFDDGALGVGKHATAVQGVAVGRPLGDGGPAGVAYNASSTLVQVLGMDTQSAAARMAAQQNFDVVNHSWGYANPFSFDATKAGFKQMVDSIETAAENGRGGLGTVITAAAGNYKGAGTDVNASNLTSDHHIITVGAVTSEGGLTDYSAKGAAVLVSAPSSGGQKLGVLTSDLAGAQGYSTGNTTDSFGGTSAAAPQVAGIAALMLDANSSLGWRDVKSILAYSAHTVSAASATLNGDDHYNGGGHLFSNDVGFGLVDARAATRLAETWTEISTSANEVSAHAATADKIQIKDAATTSFTLQMASGVDVESVQLALDAYHGRVSDLVIELVSPHGTVSQLLQGTNGGGQFNDWTMTSNAFLGEDSGGTWTVRITDKVAGQAGIVNKAELTVNGGQESADERFIFTDNFADRGNAAVHLNEAHAGGFDQINAAAVSTASIIDLNVGATSLIDGRAVVIDAGSVFEGAFGGDGNDRIVGNAVNNILWGGRGNDLILGGAGDDVVISGAGNDTIDGGTGIDTLRLDGAKANWALDIHSLGDKISFDTQSAAGDHDVVSSVERIVFDDAILAFDDNAEEGYRIYQAAFDRAPDLQGLTFWVRQIDKGMDMKEVAMRFMGSDEFHGRYGSDVSDGAFVNALYANVLDRAPDTQGFDYWVHALADHSLDRADVLLRFSESNENVHNVQSSIAHGVTLTNEYDHF